MNVNLRYVDLFTRGLDAAVGVFDLLGQNYQFVQPYDGAHNPYPGPRREFVARLSYTYRFED